MTTTFTSGSLLHFDQLVNAMTVLELGSLVVFPVTIFMLRKHPLIAARLPYVVITECIVTLLSGLFINLTQDTPSSAAWLQENEFSYNCAFGNWAYVIVIVFPWQIIIGRIVLFYKIAQANTWNNGLADRHTFFDRIISVIGNIWAPLDFKRATLRFELLQFFQRNNGTRSSSTDNTFLDVLDAGPDQVATRPHQNGTSTPSTTSATARRQWLMFVAEVAVWIIKIGVISALFGVLCIICMTFTKDQRLSITQNTNTGIVLYGPDFDCGVKTWDIFVQTFYIVWNLAQLAIVLVCVKRIRHDSLGMANELLIIQGFFCILWPCVAIALFLKVPGDALSDSAERVVIGLKLVAIYAHAVVVFGYPVGLIVWRNHQGRKLSKLTSFKTWRDVQTFWSTSYGAAAIQAICGEALALEIPLFLKATDKQRSLSDKEFAQIRSRFIGNDAVFELNFVGALQRKWNMPNLDDEKRKEIIALSREECFKLLLANFRLQLNNTLHRPKATLQVSKSVDVVHLQSLTEKEKDGEEAGFYAAEVEMVRSADV